MTLATEVIVFSGFNNGDNWIQEVPNPGQEPVMTVLEAVEESAVLVRVNFGSAGFSPALTAVTPTVADESENYFLSVPSSLYLSSVPLTVAPQVNPRTPVSAPSLRVAT